MPSQALALAFAALSVLLIALAVRLERPDPAAAGATPSKPSKIDRYLKSRRLALALGIALYIVPSPIYVGG